MTNLSNKSILVVDNGLFCEMARTLAQSFGKVYYCYPSPAAFPTLNAAMIGYGFEGVTLAKDPFDVIDTVDMVCYPDIGFGSQQDYLRERGMPVWGAGKAEELELDRVKTYELMEKYGYPVQEYAVVTGMDALRDYLKTHKKVFVKVSRYRGSFETFYSPSYAMIEPRLDDIETNLGSFKYILDFIIEDEIPNCAEVGIDSWCINGQFPDKVLNGIEEKGEAYAGMIQSWDSLPEPMTRFENMLCREGVLKNYMGFWSAEKRMDKHLVPWMIDVCARAPSPPNEAYQENTKNFPEIIWAGAHGEMVQPIYEKKFVAQIVMDSSWSEKHEQPISFPASNRRWVKLRNAVKINGQHRCIPQVIDSSIGSVIGLGDSLAEAMAMAREVGSSVSGYQISVKTEPLDKIKQKVDLAASFGISLLGKRL
jgi:hypothetical protein